MLEVNFVVRLSFSTGRYCDCLYKPMKNYWIEKKKRQRLTNKEIYIKMITSHTEEKLLTGLWAWMQNGKYVSSSVLELTFL